MRGQISLAFVAASILSTLCQAADAPYLAYISSDDVYVRSGPGKNYYPTAKMKRGEQVEVYRRDPGGWYAIRPPRQSFSWVSARQVDPAEKSLGVVNTERAVARVGSIFSDVRDVIQVRLNRGERVELIEREPVADGKWYKIAPPAGEFRWVHKDYLQGHEPASDVARDDREDAVSADDSDDDDDETPRSKRKRRERSDDSRSTDGIRLTSGTPPADESDEPDDRPALSAGRAATADEQPVRLPVTRRALEAGNDDNQKSFARALADIDLDLSGMVTEEIRVWSFEDIRARTARLIDRAPTAIERGQARLMMNKIDRFAELKERNDTIAQMRDETQRRNREVGRLDLVRHEESLGPRFDAVGRLAPVALRKEATPPYVLLDRAGRIVTYVTPAPNINLRSYVDKQVGINGQRGFMSELQKPHLNAQHVTLLPDVRR
jgi:SH3-like domain-containing protein